MNFQLPPAIQKNVALGQYDDLLCFVREEINNSKHANPETYMIACEIANVLEQDWLRKCMEYFVLLCDFSVKNQNEIVLEVQELLSERYEPELALQLIYYFQNKGLIKEVKSECKKLIQMVRHGDAVNKAKKIISTFDFKPEIAKTISVSHSSMKKPFEPENENLFVNLPESVTKEFKHLIGMDTVKDKLAAIAFEAILDKKRKDNSLKVTSGSGYHFMILGNPGTGKTTVARLISKLLFYYDIRRTDEVIEVDKSKIVGQYIGQTEQNMKTIIEESNGKTLFIDEAYTLYREGDGKDFGRLALEVLMKAMEDKRDSFSVILAGYKKEMNQLLEANQGIKSRINFIIEIPDYTEDELIQIAEKIAYNDMGMIITNNAFKAIKMRIKRDKIDDKFANARYIRELLFEAKRNLSLRLAKSNQYDDVSMTQLLPEDFDVNIMQTPEDIINNALVDLNSLIGLSTVKSHIDRMINSIKVQDQMRLRGVLNQDMMPSSRHMLFSGNPGTGKTTVARIIAQIYGALGLLSRPDIFVECTRSDLVASYSGQTADKVKRIIKNSLGGILFIDEAYALVQGENDSFGKEAVDTLIAEMENNRDKLIVILAGYKNEMEKLLNTNPGFKSRITTFLNFEDYSLEELMLIFNKMIVSKKHRKHPEVDGKVKKILESKSKNPDFGNARGVRNFFEHIIQNKNDRLVNLMNQGVELTDEQLVTIVSEDIF